MRLVFCCDPSTPRQPEPAYEREVRAARTLGLSFDLIDHDALVAGRLDEVARGVTKLAAEELAMFRGWMMRPSQYAQLHRLLLERGRRLVNSPAQYEHCHHLPSSFPVISAHSPRTVWLPLPGPLAIDEVMRALAPFGARPVIVKDYVKSEKHDWAGACFIPAADDRAQVERVVRRFLELRGTQLNEGLVFREFVELERVGTHPKSGMPLSREYRQFYFDGKPVLGFKYWDEAQYGDAPSAPSWQAAVAAQVQSRFFTMDLARTTAGESLIVELGDGQVAGLPDAADPLELFRSLSGAR